MSQTSTHLADVVKTIFTVEICLIQNDKVLMLKRSETKKAFPGWLTFPGGHIEEGENPLTTAIRETKKTSVTVSPKISIKIYCNPNFSKTILRFVNEIFISTSLFLNIVYHSEQT